MNRVYNYYVAIPFCQGLQPQTKAFNMSPFGFSSSPFSTLCPRIISSDVKLTRRLRALEIPFILPGLIILQLKNEKRTSLTTALWPLDQLRAFISEDEFSVTKLLLEKGK